MATDIVMQTKLWPILKDRFISTDNYNAIAKIKNACNVAEDTLLLIQNTFPTYTLHNATHSFNVCNLMADLLGDDGMSKLTGLEAAFLVLSAFYHDIGMVYEPEEKDALLDSEEFKTFQIGHPYVDIKIRENKGKIPDDIAEWYYHSIHQKRMERIPDLVIEGISIKDKLVCLCRSHGEDAESILHNDTLKSINNEIADLVFCAILLRLADIMDFDRSRAPNVLYDFLKLKDSDNTRFETSKKEFLKHKEALGFKFLNERKEGWTLPFYAKCDNIEIEHDIRLFLDTIDHELAKCKMLLPICNDRWRSFTLPISIAREENYGSNYKYGQYLFTLEQDQVIELFTGENLYPDKTVFVRELLQNAIDATLYREVIQQYNHLNYQPRIDITTWIDEEGYQWIQVADNGIGMDEQKIRDYFLRVGKSFYTSDEFIADSLKYKEQGWHFSPISRFGIGILSCFLAGDIVEVSTTTSKGSYIRLSMNASVKYFTLQTKEMQHKAKEMPSPPGEKGIGFLNTPGTSIAVRVNPKQYIDELNFYEIINRFVKYPPVPIYLNGEKIFQTEKEFLTALDKIDLLILHIPEYIINDVYINFKVKIKPESFIKVGLVNLGNYTTEPNKIPLKGALFLVDANLIYIDEFYEEHKNYFKEETKGAICVIHLENHRFELRIERTINDVNLDLVPFDQQKWFNDIKESNNLCKFDSSDIMKTKFDLGINLNEFKWYSEYISNFVFFDHDFVSFLEPPFDDNLNIIRSYYSSYLMYNGIISYFDVPSKFYPYRGFISYAYILLCHDKYRPNMTVSREKIQSLPMEMIAEINLAIRRAVADFEIINIHNNEKDNDNIVNRDFLEILNVNSPVITSQDIQNLSNINDWDEYYSQKTKINYNHIPFPWYRTRLTNQVDHSLPRIIYKALFQKKYLSKYIIETHEDGRNFGYIDIINENPERNKIIERYYPPLFFLLFDDIKTFIFTNESHSIKSYNGGFLNREHPDSEWLIAHTQSLHDGYPALFLALVNAVIYREEDRFSALWAKIKSLPLKSN